MTGIILQIIGLDNEDYVIRFYIERDKVVSFKKSELVKVFPEEGVQYYALIDADKIGRGHLMCRVEITDKEAYWNGRVRPVVISGYTGYDVGVCEGEGRTIECNGYRVSFVRKVDVPKNMRGVFAGVTKVSFADLAEDVILRFPARSEQSFTIDALPGERIIVAVPYDGEEATKDDGFGGKMPFETEVDGANAKEMYVDGVLYRIYGEISIVGGKYKIYIG